MTQSNFVVIYHSSKTKVYTQCRPSEVIIYCSVDFFIWETYTDIEFLVA